MECLSDLQESFQLKAAGSTPKAGTVEGVPYRENSLEGVGTVRIVAYVERTWRTSLNFCDVLSSRDALWRISSSGRISSTSSSSLRL